MKTGKNLLGTGLLTSDEERIITEHSTPAAVQEFLNGLSYNFESDGVATLRSLRCVIRDKTAHCIEGALAAAAILSHHGHAPHIACIEARDIDHIVCLY